MRDFLQQAKQTHSCIAIGELIYNPKTQSLHQDAIAIDLEPRTIELLELLLTSVGHPLSADTIIETIWQSKFISKNALTYRKFAFLLLMLAGFLTATIFYLGSHGIKLIYK